MLAAERALEHLQGGEMRAGVLLHRDGHVGEIARHLERRVEGHDRLRRHRRAQRRELAAARAALDPVDRRPFAHIVAVGRAALEHAFLEALENLALGRVALAILVGRRHRHVEPGLLEQPLLDADQHRQVEHRVVGGDPDDGVGHDASPRESILA